MARAWQIGGDDLPNRRKPKRSTEKGDARTKLIAALTLHHQYSDGSCLNWTPIGNNELARKADVDKSTASVFFGNSFKGHRKYAAACRHKANLLNALKMLNDEFPPWLLYGSTPPGEGGRDDKD